jgi:thiaminase/transcriptional activator TenA
MPTTASPPRGFAVPPFAATCLDHAAAAWQASFDHPFVVALADGTLDAARFRFYQMQDARYLEAFADAAALIATRCPDPDDKLWFLDAARGALAIERALHEGYGHTLGYDAAQIAALTLTPNNRAYQDHMISTALRGSLLEAIAALTPCPWLYRDLGAHFCQQLGGAIPEDHPYTAWLNTYADPTMDAYMARMLGLLQRAADAAPSQAERARALDAFTTSARYEWMFWEQAWTLQPWPA